MHVRHAVGVSDVGTEDRPRMHVGAGDGEVAVVSCGSAQTGGLNLMANCAGNAIGSGGVRLAVELERQRERTSVWRLWALSMRFCKGMWQMEHSFWMAALGSGWSIISRRTLPCQ